MAAFNTAQSLARAIATDTGYARADDGAHALIRTALAGSGDIIPDHDPGTLHIRLDPSTRHATQRNFCKPNGLRPPVVVLRALDSGRPALVFLRDGICGLTVGRLPGGVAGRGRRWSERHRTGRPVRRCCAHRPAAGRPDVLPAGG